MFEPASALAIISTCTVLSVGGFPPEYKLYVFGDLGQAFTAAFELNDHGQIVGYGFDSSWEAHGFLWENGRMVDLDEGFADPELILAIGAVIADDGTVGVYAWDGASTTTARLAVWRDGVATVLPLPDECDRGGDINAIDSGGTMIVGECRDGTHLFPVIWQVSDGTPMIIDRPDDIPAEADGEIMDINRQGTGAVNYRQSGKPTRSYFWRDGELEEIPNPFQPGNHINVYSLNDNDAYLAGSRDASDLWSGIMVDGDGSVCILPLDGTVLNNTLVVAGEILNNGVHPMVWFSEAETLVELVGYFGDTYENIFPWAINNYGWIIGYAEVPAGDVIDAWLLVPLYDKGDYDGDGDVDLQDSGHFQRCFAAEPYIDGTLHVGCSVFDFDDDVDLDLDDYAAFQSAFTGPTNPGDF